MNNRTNLQTTYQKAIKFAAEKHGKENQLIPGTTIPYVVHLSNVCMEVLLADRHTQKFNLSLAIQIALLHDILEDTDTNENELEEIFGRIVTSCVKALTKEDKLPKESQMTDSINRIKKMPLEVWAVKMADRITNLQPPPNNWGKEKILKYKNEAELIHEELKDGNKYLEERLKTEIKNYERYCE